jgi:hypothetical protein
MSAPPSFGEGFAFACTLFACSDSAAMIAAYTERTEQLGDGALLMLRTEDVIAASRCVRVECS